MKLIIYVIKIHIYLLGHFMRVINVKLICVKDSLTKTIWWSKSSNVNDSSIYITFRVHVATFYWINTKLRVFIEYMWLVHDWPQTSSQVKVALMHNLLHGMICLADMFELNTWWTSCFREEHMIKGLITISFKRAFLGLLLG